VSAELERALRGIAADGWYESAAAYGLPAPLERAILEWREKALPYALRQEQLVPHLTACFFGRMRGHELRALLEAVHTRPWRELCVELGPLGAFRRGESIANMHIAVRPGAALMDAHRRLLEIGGRFAWFSPGRYVGAGYTPHISLVDQAEFRSSDVLSLAPWWSEGETVQLARPHVLGKRLDPRILLDLGPRS